MQESSPRARLESVSLLDEQLYSAYRRAQRSTREDELEAIADEIRAMEHSRAALLKDLLHKPDRH